MGEAVERRKGVFHPMASNGVSCSSRRSGGGGREEKFAEGWVPNGKDDKDSVSPKCLSGENTILFMLMTSSNPNKLFLGCPFYKVSKATVWNSVCVKVYPQNQIFW